MELIGFAFAQIVIFGVGVVAGCVLAGTVWLLTRRMTSGRNQAVIFALLFPVIAAFYLEGAWLSYGIVEYATGKDSFVDGIYHYRLAGDYRLVIMDKMPEQAYMESSGRPGANTISEVRDFQVSGNQIVLTSHKDETGTDWGPDKKADQLFIIDAASGSVRRYDSTSDLQAAASSIGLTLHLSSVQDALTVSVAKARPGWIFAFLIFVPVIICAGWSLNWLRVRRAKSVAAFG
jgi:hypothetical protein